MGIVILNCYPKFKCISNLKAFLNPIYKCHTTVNNLIKCHLSGPFSKRQPSFSQQWERSAQCVENVLSLAESVPQLTMTWAKLALSPLTLLMAGEDERVWTEVLIPLQTRGWEIWSGHGFDLSRGQNAAGSGRPLRVKYTWWSVAFFFLSFFFKAQDFRFSFLFGKLSDSILMHLKFWYFTGLTWTMLTNQTLIPWVPLNQPTHRCALIMLHVWNMWPAAWAATHGAYIVLSHTLTWMHTLSSWQWLSLNFRSIRCSQSFLQSLSLTLIDSIVEEN